MATAVVPPGIGDRLGEILLSENLLTREQLSQAVSEQKSSGHRLGYVLVKMGVLPEVEVTKVLARQHRMPTVDLSRFEVDQKILKLIPRTSPGSTVCCRSSGVGRTLTVAMADPTDHGLLQDLKFITRFDLFPVLAERVHLRNLIEKCYEQATRPSRRNSPRSSRTWRASA
ncbi:MAG: hypothetical protein R2882_05735 [Gemmatimonadales bacterium]